MIASLRLGRRPEASSGLDHQRSNGFSAFLSQGARGRQPGWGDAPQSRHDGWGPAAPRTQGDGYLSSYGRMYGDGAGQGYDSVAEARQADQAAQQAPAPASGSSALAERLAALRAEVYAGGAQSGAQAAQRAPVGARGSDAGFDQNGRSSGGWGSSCGAAPGLISDEASGLAYDPQSGLTYAPDGRAYDEYGRLVDAGQAIPARGAQGWDAAGAASDARSLPERLAALRESAYAGAAGAERSRAAI